jgi:outer membrane lipase/esterase
MFTKMTPSLAITLKTIGCSLLATTALTVATPASAQNFSFLFPSPDQATAPTGSAAEVNNQMPIASINAITGFGKTFGFGSSSTDTRSSVPVFPGYGDRYSNGNAVYVELFSPLIGASNVSGSTTPLATPTPTNFGIGGTNSATALAEVGQFQAAYGTFKPNDIAVLWSGINDWDAGGVNPTTFKTIAAANVANQTTMVSQFLGLGARNVLVLGQAPFGTFQFFTNPITAGTSDAASINAGAALVDQGLMTNLIALHNQTGANIHFFDTSLFISEIRANPTTYGFSVAGVQPLTNCFSLLGLTTASCPAGASFATQNQFLSWDGIHYTYRFHELLSLAIANQLLAPYTMATQAEIAEGSAEGFADSLMGRLDAIRYQNTAAGPYASTYNSYAMATKAPPLKAPPVDPLGAFTIFAMGTYAHGNQNDRLGAAGYDDNTGAGTVGFDYRWSRNLLLGGAFSYSDSTSNINLGGNTSTEVKSYQFAGFASLNYTNWFSDLVVSGGLNNYNISRPGLVGNLTATPSGTDFVAAWKTGYLFDTPVVRLGPIGGLTYSKVWIDAYSENGDPLLTQAVSKQQLEGLTGSAGVQFRLPTTAMSRFNPFLNLTVEHDFIGDARVITTAQTYALGLPIATQVMDGHSQTYGKVAGGTSVELGGRFSATINAESTFARQGGNFMAVTAGLNARL